MAGGWDEVAGRVAGGTSLLLVGPRESGKTGAAAAIAERLVRRGLRVGGVISPRVLAGSGTVGYRVRDLMTGEERDLCSQRPPGIRFRRYFFSPEGIAFGVRAILAAAATADIVVVDEVGPLELSGGGFYPALRRLQGMEKPFIVTVRPSLADEVVERLGLRGRGLLRITLPRTPRAGSSPGTAPGKAPGGSRI